MEYFASQDPRSASYSFYFDLNISGPKSYRDFRETGPCTKNAEVMGLKPV